MASPQDLVDQLTRLAGAITAYTSAHPDLVISDTAQELIDTATKAAADAVDAVIPPMA